MLDVDWFGHQTVNPFGDLVLPVMVTRTLRCAASRMRWSMVFILVLGFVDVILFD